MAINSTHCALIGAYVVRVTDLEGNVERLICPEYDASTDRCRIKERAAGGGPLAQLVARTSDGGLAQRDARCDLC